MIARPLPIHGVRFLSDPGISPRGNGDEWAMLADWSIQSESEEGELLTLTVPAGFATDLASVPRLPGAYLLFGNKARRAAILHDWLYANHWPREWADSMFYAAMANEVNKATAWAMWAAVRMGGASYYNERSNQPREEIAP